MPCSADSKPGAIILAGGRGSRMQDADKGLVEANGKRLIEYVIDSIGRDVDEIVISANRNHEDYLQYSNKVIADEPAFTFQGPLAGIASCLPHCRQAEVLVTSCDIPLLPDKLPRELQLALRGVDVSISQHHERLQPVFMLRQHCLASIRNALRNQELGLMQWIRNQPHHIVNFEAPPPVFLNINTAEALQQLRQSLATASR